MRTAPTHGPSGAALIQGSGAEPGRQRGRSSPETLKAAPSALLQRWPPPGYHPPDARQPRQPHRGKWLCRGFPAASNHRHPSSPSPGDHTSEVKGSQGWAPCRGSRGGSSRLFQPPGAPGVRPWAGGRLPPVSTAVSSRLLRCVRVSVLRWRERWGRVQERTLGTFVTQRLEISFLVLRPGSLAEAQKMA